METLALEVAPLYTLPAAGQAIRKLRCRALTAAASRCASERTAGAAMEFIVRGVPPEIADEVRRTHVAGLRPPCAPRSGGRYGTCRCCLRTFVPGADRRLLFTYRPQGRGNSLTAPGPVHPCQHCDAYMGEGFPGGCAACRWLLSRESRAVASTIFPRAPWSRPRRRFSACSPPAALNGFICGMPKPGVSSPASSLLNPAPCAEPRLMPLRS